MAKQNNSSANVAEKNVVESDNSVIENTVENQSENASEPQSTGSIEEVFEQQVNELEDKVAELTLQIEKLTKQNIALQSENTQLQRIVDSATLSDEAEEENLILRLQKKGITAVKIAGTMYGSKIAHVNRIPIKEMDDAALQELLKLGTIFREVDSEGNFVE